MDFVTFLENNWFAIGGLIALIGTTWKMSTQLNEYKNQVAERDRQLEQKSDEKDKALDEKLDKMQTEINDKIDSIERKFNSHIEEYDGHKDDNIERTRLIMEGVEATLHSLHDEGHNGPVTKSLAEIEAYKSRKASE